ncbi:MAG: helix-turn-helix domain-containing protein [Alphaproteobacteria bacterium]
MVIACANQLEPHAFREQRPSGAPQPASPHHAPDHGGIITSLHIFARNEEIYGEGEDAHYWYRVVSGTVRSCNLLADGRRHVAEFFFPNDFFGFRAEERYLTSAEAVDEVILTRYPSAALKHLSQTNPNLARWLHELAARNLAETSSRMVLLARKTAHERVASFLLDLADRTNSGRRVALPMARHDIADHLGLTYETVCRVISKMKRSGTIKVLEDAHQIELVDCLSLEIMRAGGGQARDAAAA